MYYKDSDDSGYPARKKKRFEPKEAKLKAANYCAYQERTQQQVRDKLYSYGLHMDEVEEVLSTLISENFINEERFAIAYVGGKFRVKKWGRLKILKGLKQHNISEYCVKKGMKEIDEKDYLLCLTTLIEKRNEQISETNHLKRKAKLVNYATGKGFESALIWQVINDLSAN